MTYAPILGPVVALVAWTLVVWLWMYATRLPAMRRAGIELKGRVGGRGQNLDGILPDRVQWVSHNYNHLMEQPTLFYAVAISLAILGTTEGAALWLAWGYVGFRVAHSLWQTTVNIVKYRFLLFAAASLCLAGLVAIAAAEVWQAGASGNLLAPVAALAAWSLIMMVWMLVLRLRVTTQLGMTLDSVPRGARGDRLDGWAPDSVQWKAHNYNHLMEQPTLFYAVAISLVLLGDYDQATANFGWAYVGLRVAHSLVQATVNIVKFRLALFVLGTGVQFLLTIRMAALVARASAGG